LFCVYSIILVMYICFFFFQAEDGIRDATVTGVQTCALPIFGVERANRGLAIGAFPRVGQTIQFQLRDAAAADRDLIELLEEAHKIGRASCRERGWVEGVGGA